MGIVSPARRNFHEENCRRFQDWRRVRPFSGGLLTMLSGLPIIYFPYAGASASQFSLQMTTAGGSASLGIGLLLLTLGLTMWFQPHVRVFASIAAIVLGLLSIPLSNLGGFFVGLLLTLLGGALSIAWVPVDSTKP